jgi:prophage tail gpP-like protein
MSPTFASAAPVELRVAGAEHRGWRAMKATLSLDAPAAKFTLELADRWSADPDGVPRGVRAGAACELHLDGEAVAIGWIDAVEADYDARDHRLTVVARDKLGDLVDCAAVLDGAHEWQGLRLDEIARRLAQPYGVTVVAEVDPGAPFPRVAIQPGETAWETLQRAAQARGLLLAGDGTGRLRLTRSSLAGPAAGAITLGENVRSARAVFDHADRHSIVVVRGHGEGQDLPDVIFETVPDSDPPQRRLVEGGERAAIARAEGRAADIAITRYRPRVILAEAAGDGISFAERAAWEVRRAAGRGTRIAYVVPGWRGSSGALWRTNTRVRVRDAFLGLDADMLICGVTFSLTDSDGSLTEIEVTLPDAYDVLPKPLSGDGDGLAPGRVTIRENGRERPATPQEVAELYRAAGLRPPR